MTFSLSTARDLRSLGPIFLALFPVPCSWTNARIACMDTPFGWQFDLGMKSRKILLLGDVGFGCRSRGILCVSPLARADSFADRAEMLALMPEDATAVVFLDLAQFRTSPFLAQLFAWAPRPAVEEDYAQFVKATGFNYEKDLDRFAVAFSQQSKDTIRFAIAEGRFDRKKIEEYAERSGLRISHNGVVVFSINWKNASRPSFFTFLRDDRIAWTDDPSYSALFQKPRSESSTAEWAEHFSRLGGTPVFGVLRQDGSAMASLAQQAPGGFRSPQLASLLAQLQWITVGGKPEGDILRVVIDGECANESHDSSVEGFLRRNNCAGAGGTERAGHSQEVGSTRQGTPI